MTPKEKFEAASKFNDKFLEEHNNDIEVRMTDTIRYLMNQKYMEGYLDGCKEILDKTTIDNE